MADFGESVPSTLAHIFPPVLSRTLYKPKVSKSNNVNIGISYYAGLGRPNRKVSVAMGSSCA